MNDMPDTQTSGDTGRDDDERDDERDEDDDQRDDDDREDGDDRDEDDRDDDEEEEDDEDGDDEDEEEDDDEDGRHGSRGPREDYESARPDDSTVVEYQRRDADALFLSGQPCTRADCQNVYNEAEAAWIKLVSAIPIAGQVQMLTVETKGTPAPSQQAIRNLVAEVRPDDPDKYALRMVSEHWQTFKNDFDTDPANGIAPMLKSALRTLSETWKGADFDAFAEQVEIVLTNCASVCDDIGDATTGAVGLLEQKADEFYGLQGGDSGELPYPAPQYWIPDPSTMYTEPYIHVRPPFRSGECDVSAGCDHDGGIIGALLELGGFDKEYVHEVNDYVENQTEYYMRKHKNDEPPITQEQAAAWARADANENMSSDVNVGVEDYEGRSRVANEDVVNRWENAEESASTFQPEAYPSSPSTFRDSSDMLADSYGGLDAGSGGLDAGGSSLDGAGGGGGAGGLEPPGGVSGGLASGGAGSATLGSGGSFPVGSASATGLGAAGNTAAGMGGSGGGMGMGGMMGGGMGGARGMGGEDGPEGEHKDWLEEDEEIWGIIRNAEDDPYA
ncbi:hypothetical protein [Glycomyces terrestris]|uniref:Uncharacterized protein n=1 Tax=Glycomyces terrestris TaxID=2493553 RepID=A0A426UY37_9ACTN|nr:hypothetical protein [Glycomyces terrestris]RRR99486.1 hypothetical protein EIW28_12330 [Glycomyces terrestris]